MRKPFVPQAAAGLLLVSCLSVLGCGESGATIPTTAPVTAPSGGSHPVGKSRPNGTYRCVTTVGMVTNIVRIVAGDKADVRGLMGEGVDPHLYKPTRNDVKQLMDADIVFFSGLTLEGRMGDTFLQVSRKGKSVFAVTEQIDPSYLREPPEFAGHYDPHVWMDVSAWSECVAFVAKTLAEFDPPHADSYRKNAEPYRAELAKLHEYARQTIASIPESQRVLVTAHDAFGYFSRAYNIPVRSVQGLSTESEASAKDVADLVDFLVEHKVQAVFIESSVNPKSIRKIISDAKQRGWSVAIGGELFSDAMGKPGTYEGTYVGMIDHNVTTIARALGGKAPARGLHGKLAGPK